jgi:tetratricopeptide (TPR) repeat protein
MSIGETLSRLLLARLVEDVFQTGGALALDAVIDFLTRCGQQDDPRLTLALERAMQRAWRAVEVALGDESAGDYSQVGFSPRDAQTLRHCLARVLAELAPGADEVASALRRQCREDLRAAHNRGTLAGCVDHQEWARSQELFVRFVTEQGRPETRRHTEGQLQRDLEKDGCVGLMRLLTGAAGLPLVLMAARAFACQELTQLLYACLQENPEETPDDCGLVLETLHELSNPQFAVWRSPAPALMPVHWSRLVGGPAEPHPDPPPSAATEPSAAERAWERFVSWQALPSVSRSRAILGTVLALAAVLLVGLPIWLIVEDARWHHAEQQQVALERQRLQEERRQLKAQQQRLLDEQRRLEQEEAAQERTLERQRQEQERRRQAQAEEAKRQALEEAEERRQAQREQQQKEQRRARWEQQRNLEKARVVLSDGLFHAACRQDREALAALSEALKLDPDITSAWRERGEVRRRLGDLDGALADLYEAVRRDPKDARAWFDLGELHAQRRENRRAIEALTAVLLLQPKSARAYQQRGVCYGRIDELKKALADETRAIELTPDDPLGYFHRAVIHRLRRDPDRAFADYTAAIDRDHTSDRALTGAYRGRGLLCLERKKYEQAIRDLSHALELDPADTVARVGRGKAYAANYAWDNVLLDAEAVLRHEGDNSEAYKLRGQAHMGLDEYRKADADFTQVLRLGRDAETFYLRARARAHLGEIQQAIFDCNSATSLNPRLASAFYLRGTLNLREGYQQSGREDLRMAHQLDSSYALP